MADEFEKEETDDGMPQPLKTMNLEDIHKLSNNHNPAGKM